MSDCIFCRIAAGTIPVEKLVETDHTLVFKDLNPVAPVHYLIIPKAHVATLNNLEDLGDVAAADLLRTARKAAEAAGVADSGYRVVGNVNRDGGQEVFHLHLHLLGGKKLGWPPG